MKSYDIIWIGTGQATGTAIPSLTQAGKKIAIIEGGRFGGSCINYGCTPTKALVASARVAYHVRQAETYGIDVDDFAINFDRVMQRQIDIRQKGSDGLESRLTGLEHVDVYKEYGRFHDSHTVMVGDEKLHGEIIVIHTGARPRKPDIPGLDQVDWLDNDRLLNVDKKPKHLIILGGSYIGMEFGQAFRRFGSDITILEKGDQLMFREDQDVAEIAKEIAEKEGVSVNLNTEIKRVAKTTDGVKVEFIREDRSHTIEGSHLLVAAGRQPNSDDLNLDFAGVDTIKQGYIKVNDYGQTNIPHIFALGDVNGQGAFTHTSVNDGQVFTDFYLDKGKRKISDRTLIYNLYIDPPLGRVGMNEKMAQKSDKNVLMATMPMDKVSRANEKGETDGMIKLLVDADTEQFLGATIFGTGGDEIVSVIATFMASKQSYKEFQKAVLPHPTVAEMLPFVLNGLEPLNPSA
jgi:pyruvate/2-oxoglutarate dehydrogenase complex dihydrolipoamide dehydrogenase (E3) component